MVPLERLQQITDRFEYLEAQIELAASLCDRYSTDGCRAARQSQRLT